MQRIDLVGLGVHVVELSGFAFVLDVDVTLDPKHVPIIARILDRDPSPPYSGTALPRSGTKERLHTLQRSPAQARERRWKARPVATSAPEVVRYATPAPRTKNSERTASFLGSGRSAVRAQSYESFGQVRSEGVIR